VPEAPNILAVLTSATSDQELPSYDSTTLVVAGGDPSEVLPDAAIAAVVSPPDIIPNLAVFKLPPDDHDPIGAPPSLIFLNCPVDEL